MSKASRGIPSSNSTAKMVGLKHRWCARRTRRTLSEHVLRIPRRVRRSVPAPAVVHRLGREACLVSGKANCSDHFPPNSGAFARAPALSV